MTELILYVNPQKPEKMKPKMKYSTTKISPAKMNNSAGSKVVVKSPKLRSKELSISDCFAHYFYLLSDFFIDVHTSCLAKTY